MVVSCFCGLWVPYLGVTNLYPVFRLLFNYSLGIFPNILISVLPCYNSHKGRPVLIFYDVPPFCLIFLWELLNYLTQFPFKAKRINCVSLMKISPLAVLKCLHYAKRYFVISQREMQIHHFLQVESF